MTTPTTLTNAEFAGAVGIHFTMASRLRNGERKPGLETVVSTAKAYDLSPEQVYEWLMEIDKGDLQSGIWLRKNVFERAAAA